MATCPKTRSVEVGVQGRPTQIKGARNNVTLYQSQFAGALFSSECSVIAY